LSLAKFLFITATDEQKLTTHNIREYLEYVFERINLERDVHFYTNTTIDTLDYSGTALNSGSKVVFAAYGQVLRSLATSIPESLLQLQGFDNAQLVMPGVVSLQAGSFKSYEQAVVQMKVLDEQLSDADLKEVIMIVLADDAGFAAENLRNFLWVTFTRCNPSHDIYGINAFVQHKHWGCKGPLLIDARIKPHHAPPVQTNAAVEKKIERFFDKGGSLYNVLP